MVTTPQSHSADKQFESRALWYIAPEQAEIRSEPVPVLRPDQIRVRTLFGALSRGTETLVWTGRVPAAEYSRMRAPFMDGDFPFPVKYGYSSVGRVEHGSEDLLGKLVFSLSPHQTVLTIAANAVATLPLDVPPARAVLAANMETALNAVWDAAPGPADRIAIVGGGVVGMLVAFLCGQLPGADSRCSSR